MLNKGIRTVQLTVMFLFFGALFVNAEQEDTYNIDDALNEYNVIYEDIDDHWAEAEIEALFNNGSIRIPMGELFGPEEAISKADFLYMLLTTKGIVPDLGVKQTSFNDVTVEDWFFPYVETAYRIGMIHGESGDNFYPNEPITRQWAIQLMVSSLGEGQKAANIDNIESQLNEFVDMNEIDTYAQAAIAFAVDQGYLTGTVKEDGTYIRPLEYLTRAEAAKMIYNTLYLRLTDLQKEDVDGVPVLFHEKVEVAIAYAYTKSDQNVGSKTALGWTVREGIVAVDPKIIPYGTHMYIPGYGYAVAADRGSNIKDLKIDLYMHSYNEAIKFGKKVDFAIYLLDPVSVSSME